jgi:hypothetical protein
MIQTSNVSSCNIRTNDLNQWIADTQARIAKKGKAK